MIQLKNISHSFGAKQVLADINLLFEDHLAHVLVGSSGCGKSTLLRIILGVIQPTTGSVHIDRRPLATYQQRELGERFGYVVQNAALFPHLTARQNVELPGKTHGWERTRTAQRIEELAELVRLESSLLEKFPSQLSGGQQQRISLIRALLLDPPYLLMDEPLSALDPMIRADLQEELCMLFTQLKKTVIFVTHNLEEANLLANRVYLVNTGHIEQEGSFQDLYQEPRTEFVRLFFRAQTKHAIFGNGRRSG